MKGKSAFRILAALLLLALVVPMMPTAHADAKPKPTIVYLGLGDSLAEGYGATDPEHLGYVPRLYGFFHGMPHGNVDSFTNLGLGGESSASFIANGQLAHALAIIDDPATMMGVVTFDIGSNDLLGLLTTEPCRSDPTGLPCQQAAAGIVTAFGNNYGFILANLTAHLAADPGHAKLLVMTYYNPWSGVEDPAAEAVATGVDMVLFGTDFQNPSHQPNCADQSTWGVNDIITCVGNSLGATVVDTYPYFDGVSPQFTHILEGDIHPTNAGYARIADAFKRAFQH